MASETDPALRIARRLMIVFLAGTFFAAAMTRVAAGAGLAGPGVLALLLVVGYVVSFMCFEMGGISDAMRA